MLRKVLVEGGGGGGGGGELRTPLGPLYWTVNHQSNDLFGLPARWTDY